MSHFTVVVAVRADDAQDAEDRLDDLLEPFNENREMPPYVDWCDDDTVARAVKFYRENPEHCTEDGEGPAKPFDDYVTEGNLEAFNEWGRMAVGGYCADDRHAGVYDAESHRFGYMSRYNPDSKWDWWQLGGRWNGFWQLKPGVRVGSLPVPAWRQALGGPVGDDRVEGSQTIPNADETSVAILGNSGVFGNDVGENFEGRADLARKGDIDFETARTLAVQEADATYDKFEATIKGLDDPSKWVTWQEFRVRTFVDHGIDPDANYSLVEDETERERLIAQYREVMDRARAGYHSLPWIEALREADLDSFFGEVVEDFCVRDGGRERFLERARLSAGRGYALLIDGNWYQKGEMGWFGIASNELDPDDWAKQYWRLVDALPDDVYLAAVDMHI